MKTRIKKAIAGVTAIATAAVVAPLLAAAPAFATPPSAQSGLTFSPNSGTGSTAFQIGVPIGSECPGDFFAGWTVETYMVPASVDPSTLQFNTNGPIPNGVGAAFVQPLFDTFGTPYLNMAPSAAAIAGGPGLIIPIGTADLQVFLPGEVPAGVYNIGMACAKGPASATQLDKYWNTKITVSTNTTGGNAQVSWVKGAVPAAPTLTAVTPADGTLTAEFTQPAGSDPVVTGFTATATPTVGAAVSATGATSPIVIPGLTNNTSYSVTVHATNLAGNSAESNPAVNGTPNLTRVPVQNLVATPGTGSVALSWSPPADVATYPVTGYTVSNTPAGGTMTGAGTARDITGLTAGTLYTFTVTPTYASGPAGMPAMVSATPLSAQVLLQDVEVNRPAGALVLTQVCGINGVIPAETAPSLGFPTALPAVPADSTGPSGPTQTAEGTDTDPRYAEGNYPYPQNADGTPNATYPTHCGINLGNAKFVTSGDGSGQFFAASGVLNQVTIVDTRDTDAGWTVAGKMGRFMNQSNNSVTFAGSQLGWSPVMTDDSDAFTDSDGITYDQVATAGDVANPSAPVNTGLGQGVTLASAAPLGGTNPNFTGGFGIAQLDARLKLLIPVTKKSGVYKGVLTLTVT